MRATTCGLVVLMLCWTAGAYAQPEPPEEAVEAPVAELPDEMELLRQMGLDDEQAMFFTLLTSKQMDPAQMMMLMMMMDGGGMGGDAMGFFMLMNAMSKAGGVAQPVWFRDGESLFIAEEGVLYKVNTETMTIEGKVAYKGNGAGGGVQALKLLQPMIQRAREKALQTSCMSNLKQLCLSTIMYAQDHDELLPPKTWAQDTFPYCKNRAIYVCPSRTQLPVGYAMNRMVLGMRLANVPRPAETVLLFESNIGGENPVGGADDVPEGGVHNGGINVGFVDGHVKWMTVAEAKRLLGQAAF